MKKHINFLLPLSIAIVMATGCSNKTEKMEQELKTFISEWEAKVEPLQKEAALAYWNASISDRKSVV